MENNRLTSLLNIRYPIIQGGMVWISDWRLASACSNAGILGTLGLGAMSPEEVVLNIKKMIGETRRPFAVNIPMLRKDADDIGKTAVDMGVPVLITSAGDPDKIIPPLKQDGVLVIHVVPSVKGAVKAMNAGADAVICEGFEAGGHNSPYETTTLALTSQVRDAVNIPVIAAGGIADGRGIAAVTALGADGAQLGTRFIATKECPAHITHKKMIIDADDKSTLIIGRKISMLRVLRNAFATRMEIAENQGADKEKLHKIIGDEFNRNKGASILGDLDEGTFQAGQSSGGVREILSVTDLVEKLIAEYNDAVGSLKRM